MAAYEASIFKTLKELDKEIYEIFLNIAVEKLHTKQGGIQAPIFHPLDFFEPEKPFWERVINSITEGDEKTRFLGWRLSTIPLKELNAALAKMNTFPDGIDPSDFELFISLASKASILKYLLRDTDRCRTIMSVVQAKLQFVQSFCDKHQLDLEVLKNYKQLSHIFGTESIESGSDSKNKKSFSISSSSIQTSEALLAQKEGFLACQKILFLDVLELEKQKAVLDKEIEQLCKQNRFDKKAILDLAKNKELSEFKGLEEAMRLANQDLELDCKLEKYRNEVNTVKQSLSSLLSIKPYRKILDCLVQDYKISSLFFAEKIVAICGHGLQHPYRLPLTEQEYMIFLEQKFSAKIKEVKNEIYYRTAEKNILVICNDSDFTPLEQLKRYLDYMIQVIELGSYETDIFHNRKIDYSIIVNRSADKVEILKKQKEIPEFLYHYYLQLKDIVIRINLEQELSDINSAYYLAIIRLKLPPQENEIHYRWHLKFLNLLRNMIDVRKAALPLSGKVSDDVSAGDPSAFSGFASFQAEDQKRRALSGNTPEPVRQDSLRLT